MAKEIRFSSVIDTAAFDKSIKEMQDKLKSVYQGSDSARNQFDLKNKVYQAGAGPAPTVADRRRVDQEEQKNRLETKNFIREQMRAQEQLGKELNKQIEMRKELLKLNKETLEVDNKISETRKKMASNETAIGGGVDYLKRTTPPPPPPSMLSRLAPNAKRALGLAAGAAAAVNFGSQLYNTAGKAPGDILMSQGSARSMYGQSAVDVLQGNGFENVFYARENANAMQMSRAERERREQTSLVGLGAKILGGGFGGASLGAIGGVPGMIVGGLAGAGMAAFTGEGNVLDRMTGVYSSQLDERQAKRYGNLLESQKNLDPVKRATMQRYLSELAPRLATQRSVGMDDSELAQSLAGGSKFGNQLTMGAMTEVLGSGGSTRGAKTQANFVNTLKRNLDLTNAGSAVGTLTGMSQSPEEGKNALIKILAEGTRLGLDSSDYVEENRKFVAAAASAVVGSGALGLSNKERVAEGFSQYVAGREGFQIQAAQNTQSIFNEMSGQGGGFRGAIKSSFINQDPNLSKLSTEDKNYVMNLTEEQVNAGGTVIEGLASKAGLSKEEMISRLKDMQGGSFLRDEDGEKTKSKLIALNRAGKSGSKEFKEAQKSLITKLAVTDPSFIGASDAKVESTTAKFVPGYVTRKDLGASAFDVESRLAGEGIKNRSGDKSVEAIGAEDAAFNKIMATFKGELDDTNVKLRTYAEQITQVTAEMGKFAPNSAAFVEATKKLSELFTKIGAAPPQGSDLTPSKGSPKNGN